MYKRKLILLGILILIILLVVLVAVLPGKGDRDGGGEGDVQKENFITEFFSPNRNKEGDKPGGSLNQSFVSEPDPEDQAKLKLQKISSIPVAGYGVFMKEEFVYVEKEPLTNTPTVPPTDFVPILRYVDRLTGNVYQTGVKEINERVISDTLIPGIKEAFFTSEGESVILRYLKQDGGAIATFVGSLPKYTLGGDSSVGQMQGSFMPDNIVSIDVSPKKERVFYLVNISEGINGVLTDKMGQGRVQVFDSPLTEWLVQWSGQNTINMTTKAAGGIPGYMYTIDTRSDDFDKVVGGINGMTTLSSHDDNFVLIGTDLLKLSVFDKQNQAIVDLRIKTLPEKCVWGKSNTSLYCAVPKFTEEAIYPDSWYQGEVLFSDQIWKIDLFGRTEIAILDPSVVEGGEAIDAISLRLDDNEDYLFFVNKKDSYLWSLDLKEN